MLWLKKLLLKFQFLRKGNRFDDELGEEMTLHLEMMVEDHIRAGMPEKEARKAALKRFGNVDSLKEDFRESWGRLVIHQLYTDFKHAGRVLRRNWVGAVFSVGAVGLGIASATVVSSLIREARDSQFSFSDRNSLVAVGWNVPNNDRLFGLILSEFESLNEQLQSVGSLVACGLRRRVALGDDSLLAMYGGGRGVSLNFFEVLQVSATIGRVFTSEDNGSGEESSIVIGDHFWEEFYSRDPDVLGQTLVVEGRPYTIIGVAPEKFSFPREDNFWYPLPSVGLAVNPAKGNQVELSFARLNAGVSVDKLQSELNLSEDRLENAYSERRRLSATGLVDLVNHHYKEYFVALWAVEAVVILVFLVSCFNVSNFLLLLNVSALSELALRKSLGATRARIVSQVLTQSGSISFFGAGAGIGVTILFARMARNLGASNSGWLAGLFSFEIGTATLAMCVAGAIFASFFSGLFPALKVSKANLYLLTKDDSKSSQSVRQGTANKILVGAQVAFSCLLMSAVFYSYGLYDTFDQANLPYNPDQIVEASFDLGNKDAPFSGNETVQFLKGVRRNFISETGLKSVGLVSGDTITLIRDDSVRINPHAGEADRTSWPRSEIRSISPDFFRSIDFKLLSGREFDGGGHAGSLPVAIVSSRFANRFWPGENPLGKRFQTTNGKESLWLTIVGIAPDRPVLNPGSDGTCFYRPFAQKVDREVSLVFKKGSRDAIAYAPYLAGAVRSVNPLIASPIPATARSSIETTRSMVSAYIFIGIVIGVISIIVAAMGVATSFSFAMNNRVKEFGIRIALGAGRLAVLLQLARYALMLLRPGLLCGLAVAIAAQASLNLFQKSAVSLPLSQYGHFFLAALAIILVTLITTSKSFFRISRLSPSGALRAE